MIQQQFHEYYDEETLLKGFYAYNDKEHASSPIVLLAHDWSGNNHFVQEKAKRLASLGFVAFAVDMYGEGKIGQTKEEKIALMSPLMEDRNLLKRRITAGLDTACKLKIGKQNKIAAIGFCFGGLCVLDLARAGAKINGVVSFHGLLKAPQTDQSVAINAHILALHGALDPMVTLTDVLSFSEEMTKRNANWELNIYGNTMHAFTNPEANDPGFGTVYNPQSDERSWRAMMDFFDEIFK